MAEHKHALLVFSKPPIPGQVKTRMTRKFGGILSDEEAAELFRRSLYDVCEMGMHACIILQRENEALRAVDPNADVVTYDFFLSTTPAENLDLMKETFDAIGPWPMEIHYLVDRGKTFDDHFDDALEQIFAQGYENVVSIGADIPAMPRSHVEQAFRWLEYFQSLGTPGFVMAPCQECGTSLIGQNRDTPINNQGVYYNMSGRPALDAYVEKVNEKDIPTAYLSPIADIDEPADLAHAISCMKAIEAAAKHNPAQFFVPQRTLDWVNAKGLRAFTPPNENHDPRDYIDNPDGTHKNVSEMTEEELAEYSAAQTAASKAIGIAGSEDAE